MGWAAQKVWNLLKTIVATATILFALFGWGVWANTSFSAIPLWDKIWMGLVVVPILLFLGVVIVMFIFFGMIVLIENLQNDFLRYRRAKEEDDEENREDERIIDIREGGKLSSGKDLTDGLADRINTKIKKEVRGETHE